MMTESEFDELWQRTEAEGYGQRLAAEYGDWNRRPRHIRGVALASIVVVAMAVPMLTIHQHQTKDYETIYCNRSGIAETQWTSLASEMLMEI